MLRNKKQNMHYAKYEAKKEGEIDGTNRERNNRTFAE